MNKDLPEDYIAEETSKIYLQRFAKPSEIAKTIYFYSDNDPYVKYEAEKEFADKVATEQILLKGAGHINAESGFDTFEEIVNYLK